MFFENRLIVFLLIFLAILSSVEVYFLTTQSMHQKKDYGHYPDSYGTHLQLNRYDDQGTLTEIITADKATHYPDTKTTEFNQVVLTTFNHQHHAPWVITTPFAIAYGKGEAIDAMGPVHMHQNASANNNEASLDTQNVHIDTQNKIVSTAAPVVANQPDMTLHGIGARYDYQKDILKILSKVQVNYQPEGK